MGKDKGGSRNHYTAVVGHLKKYIGKQTISFTEITPEWIKSFGKYLLGKVSSNTARSYLADLSTGFVEAVKKDIVLVNPFQ